jgi:hypothetical protein
MEPRARQYLDTILTELQSVIHCSFTIAMNLQSVCGVGGEECSVALKFVINVRSKIEFFVPDG